MSAPTTDVVRQDRAFQAVGARIPRIEAQIAAGGGLRYAGDLSLPGMVHGRFVRSLYPHARVRSIDSSACMELPGVVAVIDATALESAISGLPRFDLACRELERPPDQIVKPGDFRLFDRTVRFVGEAVALVLAETDAAARAAAELIEVDYELLPAAIDLDSARAPGAPLVHDDIADNRVAQIERKGGDADGALAGAALVLTREFTTSKQKQAQLERSSCLAEFRDGRLTVWTPHQAPHRARATLARVFGLPLNGVRVVLPAVGGAFGKGDALTVEPYAAAAAMITGRPVRIVLERHEDFVATESRHPTRTQITMGFAADGTIAALRARCLVDAGAYLSHSLSISAVMARQLVSTYRVSDYDVAVDVHLTNQPTSGAFRGYGGPQAVFSLEHMVDLGCAQLGVDPLEARRRMRLRDGDPFGYAGEPLIGDALETVLTQGAEAFGWKDARGAAAVRGTGGMRRGVGVATAAWKSGVVGKSPDHSAASVRVETDGSLSLASAAADLGTGIRTTLSQICAQEFGVSVERVRILPIDTDLTPYDSGAFASRSLYRNGQAVRLAAAEARQRVLEYASELLEIGVGDLDLRDGEVIARGVPERRMALSAVLRDALRAGRVFTGFGQAPRTNAPTFSAAFAEVEVDVETGQVRVVRVLAVQDVGRAINPQIVEGQIQGAIHQGLGYALSEGLVVDAESGTVLNGTYMDYRLLTSADLPPIDVLLVEEADGTGPYGAKGIAEPGIVVAAPAIANAILHATGASVRDLPMTPERVLDALDGLPSAAVPFEFP